MNCLATSQIDALSGFIVGAISSLIGVAIGYYTSYEGPMEVEASDYTTKLSLSEEEDTAEFQVYLKQRLEESEAFKTKVRRALARLHYRHPSIYVELMRQ
jgi:hypothetical protein